MKDQLVSFETAKLAKEKGFDEAVINYYMDSELSMSRYRIPEKFNSCNNGSIAAPTQSLLQKWLREVKLMTVIVSPHGSYEYDVDIYTNKIGEVITFNESSQVYEKMLEYGLQKALKLLSSNT